MSKLPKNFRHIHLELAREHGHPVGDTKHGYDILAPLQENGLIDGETATAHKKDCRVRRFRPGEEDAIGVLWRGPGGRWSFNYHDTPIEDDEAGYRFGEEHFVKGEYISIREDDGEMHTFKVMQVNEI